jgi:cytochrome c oxidase subunit 3
MSGHQTYHVPEQSKLAICMATAVALIVIGVSGALNASTFGGVESGSPFWYIFWVGIAGFVGTLFAWFRTTISENMAGMNSPQLKKSYVLGMFWFIGSEVFFFICFFGVLFYVRALAGPWLGGEGSNAETNRLLWEGFQYSWPMMETPQQAVGGPASQLVADTGTFSGPGENMAFPGFAGMFSWLPFWNTLLLHSAHCTQRHQK